MTVYSLSLDVNKSSTVSPSFFDAANNAAPDAVPTYSSSNTAVATVAQNGQQGIITGVAAGTAVITVVAAGLTDTINVTVTPVDAVMNLNIGAEQ